MNIPEAFDTQIMQMMGITPTNEEANDVREFLTDVFKSQWAGTDVPEGGDKAETVAVDLATLAFYAGQAFAADETTDEEKDKILDILGVISSFSDYLRHEVQR